MHIRWSVMGAGGIAARRTIPEGILVAPNGRLVAVMDQNVAAAERLAATYHVPGCYGREEDLLESPDIDAVYIATPTFLHSQQVIAAARCGKHILCEKPLASTAAESHHLVQVCREAQVTLGTGFMMRFHGAHLRIKQLIEQGAVGRIVSARAQLTCWYPPIPHAWRQRREVSGGGALMDMGVHCMDLLRWLLGEAHWVSAMISKQAHAYEVEDSATLLLEFVGGAHGVVEVSFNIPDAAPVNALEIYGTRGGVLARGTIGQTGGGRLSAYLTGDLAAAYDPLQAREPGEIHPVPFEHVNTYRAEIEQFAQHLISGEGIVIAGEEAARGLEVIEAGYRAAHERTAVFLS